jgi:large subunit ribosomal protein L9
MGHTVQIILQDDLPGGKGYVGEVVTVKAGYARNYLIPTRKAYYATPENLERFGVSATMMKKAESIEVEEVSEDKNGKRDKNIQLVLMFEVSYNAKHFVTMTCVI